MVISVIGVRNRAGPGARFSTAPETFRARKASFSSSLSKNGQVYTIQTSCVKGPLFILRICE